MSKLTFEEAAVRGALLRVTSYEIDLDLTRGADTFRSTTLIRFTADTGADADPAPGTFADLLAERVHEITLNGLPLDPDTVYRDERLTLEGLAAENELRVVADCAYTNTGAGLHRSVDPVDGKVYLFTHFEVQEARRVFTTFEQPDLKAPFTFTVTAPAGWTVFSASPTPAPEPSADGAHAVWRFAPTPPLPTYLTSVAAGEYHVVGDTYTSASGQEVPLRVAARASVAEHLDAEEIFEITKRGLDYYLDVFGSDFPFAKYDQVFVPEYNLSAMENAATVILRETFVFRSKVTDAVRHRRAATILHELAHMWFGDLVTMRWWDDIWLKETFATYMSVRAQVATTRWSDSWTGFANADKANAYRQDQLPSTHPVYSPAGDIEQALENFDHITYYKGASAIKQLVTWVGDEQFFEGMRKYFAAHAWGNSTLADLLGALEQASGRDLGAWSREWLSQAGVNTLRPQYTVDAGGAFTSFAVLQEAAEEHPTLRSHRLAVGLYSRGERGLERVGRVEVDVTGARTEVPELIGTRRPDVVLLNDDDLTYALIRLDEHSLGALLGSAAGVGDFTEGLPRALSWAAAWDMVRAGELAARDYVRLVLAGVDSESDTEVVQSLHASLLTALDQYVAPTARTRLTDTVAAAARRRLSTSPPGSDVQLSWALLFARVAQRPEDLALIADLRAGAATVEGLAVDVELRWALLAALVRAGQAGPAEIEAERELDGTTTGAENAAGALAAMPDARATAEAWEAAVHGTVSNGTQRALIGGTFSPIGLGVVQSGRRDLLREHTERYFAEIGEVWAGRSAEVARTVVVGLYPRLLVEQETVDRTDAYLADAAPAPALRRLLIEGRDEVIRSLRAQRVDAAATAATAA
ncbi:aminopeptidase N [Streptomyces sp. NPDC005409]|uniref:aminopeptidase N n=1 Tax=Streptomyces sp. NPDC005409 TaxID=3155342 RepID=UPI0034547ABA